MNLVRPALTSLALSGAVMACALALIFASDFSSPSSSVDALMILAGNIVVITAAAFAYMLLRRFLFTRPFCKLALYALRERTTAPGRVRSLFALTAAGEASSLALLFGFLWYLNVQLAFITLAGCLLLIGCLMLANAGMNRMWDIEADSASSGAPASEEVCIRHIEKAMQKGRVFKAWNLTAALAFHMAPWRYFLQYGAMPFAVSLAVIPGMSYYFILRGILAFAHSEITVGSFSGALAASLVTVSLCSSAFELFRTCRGIRRYFKSRNEPVSSVPDISGGDVQA